MKRKISVLLALILCCSLIAGCSSGASSQEKPVQELPTYYSDSMTGTSFVVPVGWSVSPVEGEEGSVYIYTNSADSPDMMYGYLDILEGQDDMNGLSRSVANNDLLEGYDLVEFFGVDNAAVERVYMNSLEYFRIEGDDFNNEGVPVVIWCRLDWGYMDIFAFAGDSFNAFYGQFEQLVNSADFDRDYRDLDSQYTPADEYEMASQYVSGEWSEDKFKRNGRESNYFVFDEPLTHCKGFTLEYMVHDMTKGNMKSDAKFQIFYCLSDGTWVKGKEFTLDEEGFAAVEQTLSKSSTVTRVAVHCLNAGYFNYEFSMNIRDPIYD